MTKSFCSGFVKTEYPRRRCSMNGTVERDGHWYCAKHDPDPEKAKRKRETEQAIRNAQLVLMKGSAQRIRLFPKLVKELEHLASYDRYSIDFEAAARAERIAALLKEAKEAL